MTREARRWPPDAVSCGTADPHMVDEDGQLNAERSANPMVIDQPGPGALTAGKRSESARVAMA